MLTLIYMAKLKDMLQTEREQIEWHGGSSHELIAFLRARDAIWENALSPQNLYRLVLNNTMMQDSFDVPQNATVIFLPPVTGG